MSHRIKLGYATRACPPSRADFTLHGRYPSPELHNLPNVAPPFPQPSGHFLYLLLRSREPYPQSPRAVARDGIFAKRRTRARGDRSPVAAGMIHCRRPRGGGYRHRTPINNRCRRSRSPRTLRRFCSNLCLPLPLMLLLLLLLRVRKRRHSKRVGVSLVQVG